MLKPLPSCSADPMISCVSVCIEKEKKRQRWPHSLCSDLQHLPFTEGEGRDIFHLCYQQLVSHGERMTALRELHSYSPAALHLATNQGYSSTYHTAIPVALQSPMPLLLLIPSNPNHCSSRNGAGSRVTKEWIRDRNESCEIFERKNNRHI